MQIENHVLTIGDHTEELSKLPKAATVSVWQVPTEYIASGYFVGVQMQGEPQPLPACDPKDAMFLGSLELPPHPEAELAAAKKERLKIINEACDRELKAMADTYPDGEISSWPQQVKEAEAFAANPEADVPLLDNIAAARGITTEDLASRVLAKVAEYTVAAGSIIGKKQALEDALDNADSMEALADIYWY